MAIENVWLIRTVVLRARSAELRTVDDAVNVWATQGQGVKDQNMQAVWTAFSAWKSARPNEYAMIKAAADELQDELAARWSAKPQMAGLSASALGPVGWQLQAYPGNDPLPQDQQVGALTTTEVAKINEAMMRAPSAVEAARNAILKVDVNHRRSSPAVLAEEQTFTDFFGSFDATRFAQILENFQVLVLAFKNIPKFTDWRNDKDWADTYGGCVRRKLGRRTSGALGLAGIVDIRFGRAFLGKGSYEKTSDDTVATLVHEFAHGALRAVDVPDVDANGNFQCTRVSDDPADPDFGDSTDAMNHQCSNEAMDKILAQFHPEYAAVNADNYAQFTKAIMIAKRH
jgi:hypothetical protein